VRGLGQRGEPEQQTERLVVSERVGVGDARRARALGQQQAAQRLPGRDDLRVGVVACVDELGQTELDDRGYQQEQPGVIAREADSRGPVRDRPCLDRLKPRRRAARRSSRSNPSASRIAHTVCAETGVPSAEIAWAISVTERSCARSSNTRSRIRPVLRGPFGPGLLDAKNCALPARSSEVIW